MFEKRPHPIAASLGRLSMVFFICASRSPRAGVSLRLGKMRPFPLRNSRAYDLAIAFRRVSAEQRLYPLPAYRFGHAARGSRLTNGRQCAILMFGHIKPRRADARTGREEHHGIYDRIDRGHGDCDRYRAGSDLQGV